MTKSVAEPTPHSDVRYSLDWIDVGKYVVPLVRTWARDQTKGVRGKLYVYQPADQDRRAVFDEVGYFRPIRIRRAKSSLITLDDLIATVRAMALGEPSNAKLPPAAHRPISPRVLYSVGHYEQHEHGPHYVISTYLIGRPNPGGCCDPRDFRTAAELNLRRGHLVARPNPHHCRPDLLAGLYCSWDRIDLQLRSWDRSGEIPLGLKQQLWPPADNKIVAYIHGAAIHHIEALPLCDHIIIENCGSASLDELHLATRAESIWINRGTIEAKHIDSFRSVPKVREISTYQTFITDGALRRLRWLSQGVKLSLNFAILGNESAALLAQIPGLESVGFFSRHVENLNIRKLTRCQALRNLSIKRCPLNHFGVELLPQLPSLEQLTLEDCRLTPRALSVLGRCHGLKRLHLNCAALTDKYCPQLAALPKLEHLSITGTRVTDRGLARLANCTTLKVLAISGCRGITRTAIERFRDQRADVKLISAGMF